MDISTLGTAGIVLGILAVGFLVLLIVVVWVGSIYNACVKLKNRYENAFGQIDVQLKRRYDLIPNLVEVAKGYMSHERETLEAVVAARGAAVNASAAARTTPGDPTKMQALMGAESSLTASLGRLFAVVESYPDLKANQNMLSLQEELSSTENKVAFARQAYNDAVMSYNTQIETFPNNLVANTLGFRQAALYQIEAAEQREAPKVSFGK